MKTKLFLTAIAASLFTGAFAQQDPLSTQFWNTLLHINPATAGLEYRHEAHLHYRNQWNYVNGAPSTGYANYAVKISRIHGAAGVSYRFDGISSWSQQHTALAHYAFHIPVKNSVLSIGVSGGTQTYVMDWDRHIYPESPNDPLIPRSGRHTAFTMNTGIAFHAPKWNAGFGITNLNEPSAIGYDAARHYYLSGDYTFTLSDNWSVRPRVLAATDAVTSYAQLSVEGRYKNAWLVANLRMENTIGGSVGYDFRGKWRVGYGYEVWESALNNGLLVGTHEVTVGLLLR